MSERVSIGRFGDVRREERGAWVLERSVACGSLTIRTIGETRAGEMAVHRFLDSAAVTPEEILSTLGARTAAACARRRIVAVQSLPPRRRGTQRRSTSAAVIAAAATLAAVVIMWGWGSSSIR